MNDEHFAEKFHGNLDLGLINHSSTDKQIYKTAIQLNYKIKHNKISIKQF